MLGIKKQDSFSQKGIQLIVCLTTFLVPIIFSIKHPYLSTTPKYTLIACMGSLCLVLLPIFFLEKKLHLTRPMKLFLSLAAAGVAWFFITALSGIDFNSSLWSNFGRHMGFLGYFFCFVFIVSAAVVFSKDTLYVPLKALVVGGTLAACGIYASPALFDVPMFFLRNSSNAGTFGNTTYAAMFLVPCLFVATILFLKDKRSRIRWLWVVCFFLILLNPIFFNSKAIVTGQLNTALSFVGEARAGFVAIFIGLLATATLYFSVSKKRIVSLASAGVAILVVLVGAYILFGIFREESSLRQVLIERGEVRLVYGDMALIGISQRPILGFGLENFAQIHKQYFDPILLSPEFPNEPWTDKPHNTILEIAFSTGIVGLALYLSFIGLVLIVLARAVAAAEPKMRMIPALFFGAIISYSFQGLFAFDTVVGSYTFYILSALIAVAYCGEISESPRKGIALWIKIIISICSVVLGIVILYFCSLRVGQESRMIKKMMNMSVEDRLATFETTMHRSPVGTMRSESQYIDILAGQYRKDLSSYTPKARAEAERELAFLLSYATKRSDLYPHDFRFAFVSSRIANLLFDTTELKDPHLLEMSQRYAVRAIDDSPRNPLGYQAMVEVLFLAGKRNTGMLFAQMIVDLNPRVAAAHDLVIFLAKAQKNEKLAAEKIETAKKFIPEYHYGSGK